MLCYVQVIHQYRVRNSPDYTSPHLPVVTSPHLPDYTSPHLPVVCKTSQSFLAPAPPPPPPASSHYSTPDSDDDSYAPPPAARDARPLSLVIRKNVSKQADLNSNVPEYTVHHKQYNNNNSLEPRNENQFAPYPQSEAGMGEIGVEDAEDLEDEDEDLDPPALVISEEPSPQVQDLPTDYSLGAAGSSAASPQDYSIKAQQQRLDDSAAAANVAAGLKIKEFARYAAAGSSAELEQQRSTSSGSQPKEIRSASRELEEPPQRSVSRSSPSAAAATDVDVSDVSSECQSLASEAVSEAAGRPYSGSEVVARRVSRASNGDPVYQCDFCDKMFANKSHFQSHLVTHTGERSFTCKTCAKSFGRKSTLRAHMTTHTKVSNFMCMMCEKACNDNNSLEEHLRMHTGNLNGKCLCAVLCKKKGSKKGKHSE